MANFRLYYYSEVLKMKVGVNVIIPENTWGHSLADRPKDYRYPVLWLQSGGGFDYTDWQRYTALELYASQAGVAVVCSGTYCSVTWTPSTATSSTFLSFPSKRPGSSAICSPFRRTPSRISWRVSPWAATVP